MVGSIAILVTVELSITCKFFLVAAGRKKALAALSLEPSLREIVA